MSDICSRYSIPALARGLCVSWGRETPKGLSLFLHCPTHTHTYTLVRTCKHAHTPRHGWHTLTNKHYVGLNANSSWQSSPSQAWKYAEVLLSSGWFLNLDLSASCHVFCLTIRELFYFKDLFWSACVMKMYPLERLSINRKCFTNAMIFSCSCHSRPLFSKQAAKMMTVLPNHVTWDYWEQNEVLHIPQDQSRGGELSPRFPSWRRSPQ